MPDTDLLPLFFIGTAVLTTFAAVTVIVLLLSRQRQARARLAQERLEQAHNETLLRTRIEVQEQALASVAREIHDGVGQELGSVRMALASVRPHVSSAAAADILKEGLADLKAVIGNLRLLSHSLHGGLIHQRKLEMALRNEVDRIAAFTSLRCTLTTLGEPHDLSPEAELFTFRIAQESLQNVLKHAEAAEVSVVVDWQPDSLRLRIADDGRGIGSDAGSGAGLISMRERAALMGGCLHILPALPSGTEVVLSLPQSCFLHE